MGRLQFTIGEPDEGWIRRPTGPEPFRARVKGGAQVALWIEDDLWVKIVVVASRTGHTLHFPMPDSGFVRDEEGNLCLSIDFKFKGKDVLHLRVNGREYPA